MAIIQNASPLIAMIATKYAMSNESRASIGKQMLIFHPIQSKNIRNRVNENIISALNQNQMAEYFSMQLDGSCLNLSVICERSVLRGC